MTKERQRIFLLGGSNSIMRTGYFPRLARIVGKHYEVHNLSIRASTTAMGLYRLIVDDRLASGDIVVWEYALNEFNHFWTGYAQPVMREEFAWLLKLVHDRRARFLPVVMRTLFQVLRGRPDQYTTDLLAMFDALGIAYVDCESLRRKLDPGADPQLFYVDPVHYSNHAGLLDRIAETVAARLPGSPLGGPVFHSDILASRDAQTLRVVGTFPRRTARRFENSLVEVDGFDLDAPMEVAETGRLLGLVVLASQQGGAIDLSVDGNPVARFSTRVPVAPGHPTMQLRYLSVASAAHPRSVDVHEVIRIETAASSEGAIVMPTFIEPADRQQGESTSLVALLMQAQTAAHS